MSQPADRTEQAGPTGLLAGRRAVVTGGSGSIGRAIADRFASNGCAVAVVDLDQSACADVAAGLQDRYGVNCCGASFDVSDRDAVTAGATAIESSLGGPCDVVVANAGVLILKPALELTAAEWNLTLAVNLTGAWNTAVVFAERLRQQSRGGSIIFSSSLFGLRGGAGNAAYSASKFAVIGVAQSMAAELASDGIRVNCVCPGQVSTPMLESLFVERAQRSGTTPAVERDTFEARIPLGRLGSTDEVADTYVYLASDLSRYVTGQEVVVDGGWTVG